MRIVISIVFAAMCVGGFMWAQQNGLLGSSVDTTVAMEEVESAPVTETLPTKPPAQVRSAKIEKAAGKFVAKMQELAADQKTAGDALQNVKFLLQGRTSDKPEFRAAVARQLLKRFPGSPQAAEAYRYLIMDQFQRSPRVDDDLTAKLDDFSKSYATSDLPVESYKWVCRQLTAKRDHRAALDLAKHAVDASRPYRNVKKLEGFYRMTKETHLMLSSMGPPSSGSNQQQPRSSGKKARIGQVTDADYNNFLGASFSLNGNTHEGYTFSPSSIKGNVTVVHFWATWCPACRKLTPKIRTVYDDWSSKGVKFVGVNLDADQDAAKGFISGQRLAWPHLMSEEGGWGSKVAKENKVSSIPCAFVLGTDGIVVEAGLSSVSDIEEALTIHAGQ